MTETFVRDVGRGRGVQERSLEVTEVSRQGGRRWCITWSRVRHFLEKGSGKFISPVF